MPVLQHDPARPEDVDTDAEDHAGDAARYACMSRPYVRRGPKAAPGPPRGVAQMTLDEALALQRPGRERV